MNQENLYDLINLARGMLGAVIGGVGLILRWWESIIIVIIATIILFLLTWLLSNKRFRNKADIFFYNHPWLVNNTVVNIFIVILVLTVLIGILVLILSQLSDIAINYPDVVNVTNALT